MSKRNAYPIEMLLKMKQINPKRIFEGEDLRVWNEFIEAEAETNLLDAIEEPKSAKRTRKVKQVIEPTETESLDIYETNEVPSEEEE